MPAFRADTEVRQRLDLHGWAFVLDVASVGKTTLALRMATQGQQCDHPVFYLDLASIDVVDGDMDALPALRRLSRPKSLLIIDNVHHQPELARQLWDHWQDHPRDSRLLLIGTRMQRSVITTPSQDLAHFEYHSDNPAVELSPTPQDLKHMLQSIHKRVTGVHANAALDPPQAVLLDWHHHYGHVLGAFCIAVLGRLCEFQRGNWSLPVEAAADWVQEKWLKSLNSGNHENVLCLAVFAAQDLEMVVPHEALPHPSKTDQLLKLGLVVRTEVGLFGQYRRFSLREPDWGQLILAAQGVPIDLEKVLFETAARHPLTAVVLSSRLRREGKPCLGTKLWAHLASVQDSIIRLSSDLPLSYFTTFIKEAESFKQHQLAHRCWEAIESDPTKFAERAWETPLGDLGSFLDTAKRNGRDTKPLWEAIESDPTKLAERAWETPLNDVGSFLDTAKRNGRDTKPLWEAIESDPTKLAERAWETSLNDVGSFLDTAERHGRDTKPLWEAIESDPTKLAERAWKTPLDHISSFLDTAERHGRDTEPLWQALEREPDKLSARVRDATVADLVAFIHHATDAVTRCALAALHPDHWEKIDQFQSFHGATWIAARCEEIGFQEHKSALIKVLLHRCNPQDFSPFGSGFSNAAWLLIHRSQVDHGPIGNLLDALCTKRWLGWQFAKADCGPLAAGLRMLALYQTPEIMRRFLNIGLGIRLRREFAQFAQAQPEQQSTMVQLLGCATLCGWHVRADLFANVSPSQLSRIPVDELPHRPEASKVKEYQFQLWLGLRAFVVTTGNPLKIDIEVVDRTLELWRVNLAESAQSGGSTEHKVNSEMVQWLGSCTHRHQGLLVPPA